MAPFAISTTNGIDPQTPTQYNIGGAPWGCTTSGSTILGHMSTKEV
jgi:hypothetical protein